jgi:RNA recognition motif-containing protein
MNLYVGNFDFNTTKDQLRAVFAAYGTVNTVSIVTDRLTDQYRSFGSVQMQNPAEAEQAAQALDGKVVGGHRLAVNQVPSVSRRGQHRNTEIRWWRRHV